MRPALPALTRSWSAIAGESARVARVTPVVSGVVAALAFAVPMAVLGVTGLSIQNQAAILARVDDVGTRTISIVSTGQEPVLPAHAVDRIARLQGVTWVAGLGPVIDVRNGLGVGPAPLRALRAVRAPVTFAPEPGRGAVAAYVSRLSAGRAGLGGAFGLLDPGRFPVAGWFRAAEPLSALESFILLPSRDDALRLDRIIIAVSDVGWVELVAHNATAMLGTDAASASTVERSPALLAAREAVRDEVARRDRTLVLILLAVAMVLAGLVVFAGTLGGRRDFGRRRALGATRGQLTMLVMLGTLWPALLGASAGTIAGWAYLGSQLGRAPDPSFPLSVGILAILAVVAASALPAVFAASRDPLRVLRVP